MKALYAHNEHTTAAACTSLVACLPALERVYLQLSTSMGVDGLGRLLGALASCPRLECLGLFNGVPMVYVVGYKERLPPTSMLHSLATFARLRSLRKLTLNFKGVDYCPLADVVRALVPLTGLAELAIGLSQPAVVPAALGQLTALRSLYFYNFKSCILEAGCFDLPNLLSLEFFMCAIEDAEMLESVPALPSLTCIEFLHGSGPQFVAPLIQLPQLQRMVFETERPCVGADYSDAYLGLPRLPSDISPNLLHLSLAGHGLTQFPLVLTQLVALEHLDARGNDIAELPINIRALSSLTQLLLGRYTPDTSDTPDSEPLQLHELPPWDARALGDLFAFPLLCELHFCTCQVLLCASVLGIARHARLAKLEFCDALPAGECEPIVQQLREALERLGRASMLTFTL